MKKIKLLILTLSVLSLYRCDDLSELNVDPNTAVAVAPSTLLTTSQFNYYSRVSGVNMNADWGQLMVQYWAQNEYTEESRYNVNVTHYNVSWRVFYADVLKELFSAKELVDGELISNDIKTNKKNILDVMIAQTFITLTDSYGDVPYTEAISDIPLPVYDSQETIYKSVLQTLKNASDTFVSSADSFKSGDVIYGGNVDSWKKFTNSLMLRYAMRLSDIDPATAEQYAKAAESNLISNNGENALFTFDSNQDRANPLFRNLSPLIDNRDDYCVSEYLVSTLENMGDPRLEEYAKPASGGTILGMPYGLNDNDATVLKPTTSRPNDQVREATTPHLIISYSEVEFLLAEAYQRGFLTGNAGDAYNRGIEASMNQWGITDATTISDYIANNPYNASNWKMSLGTQKWVGLYMNGLEAWSEWRRLDFPQLTVPTAAVINSIPVKLPYPLSETQNNSNQLSKVTSTPGNLTNKVWWDVN
ncbi:SusD/RagB family nutrient-binding outer membrane lipoprotein [Tenacibaculum sp. 1_MG-2023]|uniref:SusD/RagB family nutrient-binding outer membrane lipoprotein n=1 Tax=Tenacibaculum sp. 1_MG-2023 TaxID=3062653 RepID=UPI0026E13E95|nr:SusD/RagB family nutrient-binding outer membrane lipoprotein [Tenacibaculum sp. 1_MG-2023]MDO6674855.1 SusD/RagB family nutrient-binding outer membrane lipoprotein [Tenacibaculum sp. 1_MG-2023]